MAPGYRTTGQSRRNNRGQIDHDVFEGLPVRNWRREAVIVTPAPIPVAPSHRNKWDIEHYRGMPKDFHLLPQHSQEILKIARSGKTCQKKIQQDDDEPEIDTKQGDLKEKEPEQSKDRGYLVKTWKPATRHVEGAEFEFLAKRRKGLRGTDVNGNNAPTVTKATVRKTDGEGKTYVEEIIVAEGQIIDGEVISRTTISNPAAGGVDLTPRRRAAPPKRKPKGPGRGRRKKVLLPVPIVDSSGAVVKVESSTLSDDMSKESVTESGIKTEIETKDGALTISGTHVQADEGEDDEDGDEGDDGSEDDEDDDDDAEDQEQEQEPERDHDQDQEMADKDVPTPTPAPRIDEANGVAPTQDESQAKAAQTSRQENSSVPTGPGDAQDVHDDEQEAEGDDDDDVVLPEEPALLSHQDDPTHSLGVPPYYSDTGMDITAADEHTLPADFDDDNDNEMLDLNHNSNESGQDDNAYPYQPHHNEFPSEIHHVQESYDGVDHSYDEQAHATRFAPMPEQQDQSVMGHDGENPGSFQDLLADDDDDDGYGVLAALDAHLLGDVELPDEPASVLPAKEEKEKKE